MLKQVVWIQTHIGFDTSKEDAKSTTVYTPYRIRNMDYKC